MRRRESNSFAHGGSYGIMVAQLKRRAAGVRQHPDGSDATQSEASGRETLGMDSSIPAVTYNTPQHRLTLSRHVYLPAPFEGSALATGGTD